MVYSSASASDAIEHVHDTVVGLAAGVTIVAVTLAAAWLPAHRASSVDPVDSLRAE